MDLYFKNQEILGSEDIPEIGKQLGFSKYNCNRNILINHYLGNPVNRNGQKEYKGAKYGLDMWTSNASYNVLTVEDGCIRLTTSEDGKGIALWQFIQNLSDFKGKTLTFSGLYRSTVLFGAYIIGDNSNLAAGTAGASPDEWKLFSVTCTVPDENSTRLVAAIGANSITLEDDVSFLAFKLELGSVQTLAHQDEDGNWILNEIPNYAEQYALCEQYSLSTGEFVWSQYSNLNLLENAILIGGGSQRGNGQFPINQRGQTEYTENAYTIDRWKIDGTSLKLSILSECVRVERVAEAGNPSVLYRLENLGIGTYTISMLYRTNNDGTIFRFIPHDTNDARADINISNSGGAWSLLSATLKVNKDHPREDDPRFFVQFMLNRGSVVGDYIDIKAAKLELGPVQTLAHKEGDEWVLNDPPPNYAQELAKCQRYYWRLSRDSDSHGILPPAIAPTTNTLNVVIETPVPMRASPAIVPSSKDCIGYSLNTTANINASTDVILSRAINNQIIAIGVYGTFQHSTPYNIFLMPHSYIEFNAEL